MVTVYRVSAVWSGFVGAPGYSRFAFQGLTDDTSRNAAGAAVRTFFDSLKAMLPNGVNIQVQGQVDGYDMAYGNLIESSAMTTVPAVVTSTATPSPYAAGAGLYCIWNTGVIFEGHRVKGRTFIVPLQGGYYDNDGSPISTAITNAQAAGNALCAASPDFSVWSRLYNKATPPTQVGGAVASAISCTVKDVTSGLRSRRA